MQTTLLNISSILHQEDIEGLLAIGAPDDEYESEAAEIAAAVAALEPSELTVVNIIAIVSQIWSRSFNLSAVDMQLRAGAITHAAQAILA